MSTSPFGNRSSLNSPSSSNPSVTTVETPSVNSSVSQKVNALQNKISPTSSNSPSSSNPSVTILETQSVTIPNDEKFGKSNYSTSSFRPINSSLNEPVKTKNNTIPSDDTSNASDSKISKPTPFSVGTTRDSQSTPPPSIMDMSPPGSGDSNSSRSSLGSLGGAFDTRLNFNSSILSFNPASNSRDETGSSCNIFGPNMGIANKAGSKRKEREATTEETSLPDEVTNASEKANRVFYISNGSSKRGYNPDTSNAPKKR